MSWKKLLVSALMLAVSACGIADAQAGTKRADKFKADVLYLCKEQGSDPSNPAAGTAGLYCKTDGRWYFIDDAGSVFKLGDTIQDADNDTKVQVEESADENIIRLDVAGTQLGRWDSTGLNIAGNDVAPSGKLHIGAGLSAAGNINSAGDELILEGTSTAGMNIATDTTGVGYIFFVDDSSLAARINYNHQFDLFQFLVANNEKFRIGASSVVVNENGDDVNVRMEGNTNTNLFSLDAGNDRIGVGTGTPDGLFHINGADDSTHGQLKVESTGSNARIEMWNADGQTNTGRGSIMMSKSVGFEGLRFMINNSDKMILDENGALGVGTTSPDASALLDIVSTTKGLGLPSMTGTQRDAISTPRDGLTVHNTTTDTIDARLNGSWLSFETTAGTGQISCETAQASTSGTSIDFTSLPSSIRRITVIGRQVSFDANDDILVQIGDSGGLETTGYESSGHAGNTGNASSTSGFITIADAGQLTSFVYTLVRIDGNKWGAGVTAAINGGGTRYGHGIKQLSAELDRLSIVPTGSANFDNGQINVCHEL